MFLLWLLAVILFVIGVIRLVSGQILVGLLLIVLAFVIGPGGVSIIG